MTKKESKDYWNRPLREIYKDIKITWTTKGIVNGKSKIPNDGCNFGPDTLDNLGISKKGTYRLADYPLGGDVSKVMEAYQLLQERYYQEEPNSTLGLYEALQWAKAFSEGGHKVILIHMEDGKEVESDRLVIG